MDNSNIIRATLKHWKEKNAARMGAALSYYAIFSVIPIVILLVVLGSLFFSKSIIEEGILHSISDTISNNGAQNFLKILLGETTFTMRLWPAVITVGILILGAITVFTELDKDINELWNAKPIVHEQTNLRSKIKRFIQHKILAFSVIPILGILLILSVTAGIVLSLIQAQLKLHTDTAFTLGFISTTLPFLFSTLFFGFVYRVFPRVKIAWKEVWLGAVVTATLFFVGNILIGLYIQYVAHMSMYKTAGSFIAILLWIYYSSQVFFLGASFTYIYSKERGVLRSREV